MKKILLIGAGGHCKSCIDVVEQQGLYQIAGIIDKNLANESTVLGYPIIGTDEDLVDLRQEYEYAFVTVGQIKTPELKIKLFNRLTELGYKTPSIISPLAYVSKHAQVGRGTIVMHHALINAGADIGENCIINSKALVEHDALVGNHCHISTGAVINGNVKVSDNSFVGSQATTKQGVVILEKSFIKAGSVVK
jgi:sugar O-acyltransferase (sialic acid O-acetyltransferase NeuD family)